MSQCQNPKCKKEYRASANDDGFCGFDCWEEANCGTPPPTEEFDLDEIKIHH